MERILLIGFAFILASCAAAPQTRTEFVSTIKQGAGLSSFEKMTINRTLKSILVDLQAPLKECLNLKRQDYWVRGGIRTSNTVTRTYVTTLKKLSRNKAELTLQTTYDPNFGSEPPKGGFFEFAIDFQSKEQNKTIVTLYSGMSGQGDLNASFVKWINGEKADCPLTKASN